MGCVSLALHIQRRVGLDTIIHFTTRGRNLMALQSELLGAHSHGIRNILALTGDPPRMGNLPQAKAVWDVDSIGLIKILKRMNEGQDWAATRSACRPSSSWGAPSTRSRTTWTWSWTASRKLEAAPTT